MWCSVWLETTKLSYFSCLSLPSTRTTGVNHHTQAGYLFLYSYVQLFIIFVVPYEVGGCANKCYILRIISGNSNTLLNEAH